MRANDGITEALFSRRALASDAMAQDEHCLINVVLDPRQIEEGKDYWIEIQPAFPRVVADQA